MLTTLPQFFGRVDADLGSNAERLGLRLGPRSPLRAGHFPCGRVFREHAELDTTRTEHNP